jgi:hypothetical protein
MVVALKNLKSSGRCHGIAPACPMTLFSAMATMALIIGQKSFAVKASAFACLASA